MVQKVKKDESSGSTSCNTTEDTIRVIMVSDEDEDNFVFRKREVK